MDSSSQISLGCDEDFLLQRLRPDPRAGLIETMLVVEGKPLLLESHLARLSKSAQAIFGAPMPAGLAASIERAAVNTAIGRLRVSVRRGTRSNLVIRTEQAPMPAEDIFPDSDARLALRSVRVEVGLGPHKWADRSWMENLKGIQLGEIPLLISETAEILETARGNVFLFKGDLLLTPPLDGRILPGIVRAQTMALARKIGVKVVERPLSLGEITNADEAFMTGSLRGIEPIGSVDGLGIRVGRQTWKLASHIRRLWLREARTPT